MSAFLSSAALFALLATAQETAPVTFRNDALAAGTKLHVTTSHTSNMKMSMDLMPEPMEMSIGQTVEREDEFLGDGRVRMKFLKARQVSSSMMGDMEEKAPVDGRTYLVEQKEGQTVVTREDGSAAGGEEGKLVRSAAQTLFKNPWFDALGKAPVAQGAAVDMPQALARDVLAAEEGEEVEVQEFKLTLKECRDVGGRPCAAFTASVRVATAVPEMPSKIQVDLTGEVLLDTATTHVLSADLEGPMALDVEVDQGGMKMKVSIQGNMIVSTKVSVEAPAAGRP